METSLTSVFASLSIVLGLLVGFGTLSVVRGVFTFLMFMLIGEYQKHLK